MQQGQKDYFCELADQLVGKINGVNNEIIANTSYSLAMMAYVAGAGQAKLLVESKEASKFLLTQGSQINKPEALRRLSRDDVTNHLGCLRALFALQLKPAQQAQLEEVLVEYLINEEYVFRGKPLWGLLQSLQWEDKQLTQFLKKMFARV